MSKSAFDSVKLLINVTSLPLHSSRRTEKQSVHCDVMAMEEKRPAYIDKVNKIIYFILFTLSI